MDLHAGQIQGFFDIPTDNLYGAPIKVRDIKALHNGSKNVIVVSPDAGGVERAARSQAARGRWPSSKAARAGGNPK